MRRIFLILILIIFVFILSGCTNVFKVDVPTIEEKVDEEIEYLDSEVISMLNSLNNITYINYKVIPIDVKPSNTASNPNSQMNESGSSNNSEQKESLTTSGQSDSNESSKSEIKTFKMEISTTLDSNSQNIDWTKIKNNIEILHSAWITSQMDLKELGISEKELLEFSNNLNNVTLAATKEDKLKTMEELVNIYNDIDKFVNQYSNNKFKINVIDTKKNILELYLCIETLNWQEADIKISEAEQKFTQLKNNKNIEDEKKIDVERVKILINELKQCLQLQNKEIALLKYKDLIQELSIL